MKQILLILAVVVVGGCGTPSEEALPVYNIPAMKALAEQGHTEAQYYLGSAYYLGDQVRRDYTESAKWWRMAAEGGKVQAQHYLGMSYYRGRGVKSNDVIAYAWVVIANANADNNRGGYSLLREDIDRIAVEMTPEQIAEAQKLAMEMIKENPKLINRKK